MVASSKLINLMNATPAMSTSVVIQSGIGRAQLGLSEWA
jgi:hypothetical protein